MVPPWRVKVARISSPPRPRRTPAVGRDLPIRPRQVGVSEDVASRRRVAPEVALAVAVFLQDCFAVAPIRINDFANRESLPAWQSPARAGRLQRCPTLDPRPEPSPS